MRPAGKERSHTPSSGDGSHLQGEAGQVLPRAGGMDVSGP